jgi:hypothetical protein
VIVFFFLWRTKMATIDNVNEVLTDASVSGSYLVIPLSTLPSFDGTEGEGSNAGGECVLGILEALMDPPVSLASGGFSRGSVAKSIKIGSSGSGELTHTYTFTCTLNLDINSNPLNIKVS